MALLLSVYKQNQYTTTHRLFPALTTYHQNRLCANRKQLRSAVDDLNNIIKLWINSVDGVHILQIHRSTLFIVMIGPNRSFYYYITLLYVSTTLRFFMNLFTPYNITLLDRHTFKQIIATVPKLIYLV